MHSCVLLHFNVAAGKGGAHFNLFIYILYYFIYYYTTLHAAG